MTSLGLSLGLGRPAVVVAAGGVDILTAIAWKAAFWAEDPDWTPPADGAVVSSWRDAGSEAKNADAASAQPTYRASTAAFGNRPTVQFAGSHSLTTANWTTAIGTATAVTWVVVASATATGATQQFISSNTNGSSDHYLGVHSTNQWNMRRGGGGDRGGVTDTNPHLIVGVMAGSSGAGTIEVDGTLVKSIVGSGSSTLPGLCLGKYPSTNFLTGHLAFAGVISGSISAGDRTLIEEWAADTYGLTIA